MCRTRLGASLLALVAALTAAGVAAAPGLVVVDQFAALGADGLPPGWSLKQWFGNGRDIGVVTDNGHTVLRLVSRDNSFGVYRKLEFSLRDYPILVWNWKVTQLPAGGDVRQRATDDQAAQLYVLFPRFPSAVNTRLVGYTWETTTPKDLQVTSTKSSNTRYVVVETGAARLGEWVEERRNVYDDYKQLFGAEPPAVGGVTLMIDSDDTHSAAESLFGAIRFEPRAP